MAAEGEEWLVATQEGLGKLISKPKMTEKYLKKPPFRFLHDIIMEVGRTTTFGNGLFTTEESDAASLADKGAKVEFLNKAISCVCFALNEKIDVSANKIVAGLEADKTNVWLQKLHIAATTAVDKSPDAVARVMAGESVAATKKKSRPKDEAPEGGAAPAPEDNAAAAVDPAEEEAKKAEEKRRRAEKKKREEEKRRAAEEEAARAAEGGGDAEPAPPAADGGAEEEERRAKKEEERRKKEEDKRRRDERKRQQAEEEERQRQAQEAEAMQQQQQAAAQQQQAAADQQAYQQQEMMRQQQEEEQRRQMMMQQQQQQPVDDMGGDMASAPGSAQAPQRPGADAGMPLGSEEAMMQGGQAGMEEGGAPGSRPERPRTAGRKPPKVSSKVTTRQDEPGLTQGVAPPTLIAEGTKDDDDEDMFEAAVQPSGLSGMPVKADANEPHGKLVRDLLAEKKAEEDKERLRQEEEQTREEVEEPGQKGIKMGRLKRKKEQGSTYTEIDTNKLSESIQQLCQAANPLGKSIDLVHQDIANMGKELDHWKQEYREASEQHQQEHKMTEELLQPLYQKIADLDDRIAEQKAKIRNSRSRTSKNDLKIQGLLESVVMAK